MDLLRLIQTDEENQKLERIELSDFEDDLSIESQDEVSICSDDIQELSFDLSILEECP